MPEDSKSEYWLKKMANRRTGFPVGTIAYYGKTDQSASKLVVGIIQHESDEGELRKWIGIEGEDLRHNQKVQDECIQFLQENDVQRIAMLDRIQGCPHEEDIDYAGPICPECPFWADRDRWTGELRSVDLTPPRLD